MITAKDSTAEEKNNLKGNVELVAALLDRPMKCWWKLGWIFQQDYNLQPTAVEMKLVPWPSQIPIMNHTWTMCDQFLLTGDVLKF